jgi:hypothetical protein
MLRCDLSDADLDWLADLLFMPLYNDIHSGDKVLKTLRRLRLTASTLLACFKRWYLSMPLDELLSSLWLPALQTFVPLLYRYSLEEDAIFGMVWR